jgi:hypothetical protein
MVFHSYDDSFDSIERYIFYHLQSNRKGKLLIRNLYFLILYKNPFIAYKEDITILIHPLSKKIFLGQKTH